MLIDITAEPVQPEKIINEVMKDACGAVVNFLGTVRRYNEGKEVLAIEFDVYPEMARKKLEQIAGEVKAKWPIGDIAIVHRIGSMKSGEIILVIAVSAPHRKEAFEACQYVIERLKQIAPFWKKEIFADGTKWVGS